ncbi:MAG: RecQ family ATP-dependent DNA helicase, partial [Gemmatimonadetes bacterium]|nr:RecQ family ATP-dependent DNA helicase [Gemmatimonadota bacterium]
GCRGEVEVVPARTTQAIGRELWGRVEPTVHAAEEALGTPRAVARFLCGLSSPRSGRARLAKDPLFGELGEVPFVDVLAWVTACQNSDNH